MEDIQDDHFIVVGKLIVRVYVTKKPKKGVESFHISHVSTRYRISTFLS